MAKGDKLRHIQIAALGSGQKAAKKYLKLGNEYTEEKIEIHNWHTKIWLKEFPNIEFNTCQFEKVNEEKKCNNYYI
jgi:hypothetical protein